MAHSDPAKDIRRLIVLSTAGKLIEWYDLFIFGCLTAVIAGQLFPASHPSTALLFTLAIFAAGLIVRPFGARLFGPQCELTGRRSWLPLILLGGSTFAMGLIPGYQRLGYAAPLLVLLLRLVQGLASGAENGQALTYIAEHAPLNRRGSYTSWLQTTPSLGVLLSLGVILLVRHGLDADPASSIEKFNAWGWRIPFLFALVLMVVAVYIRLRIREKIPPRGRFPQESVTTPDRKTGPLVLFGATMGAGVVFYAGQFYTQTFLEKLIDFDQSRMSLLAAVALTLPFFLIFGSLSDRTGRKWLLLSGLLLSVCTGPVLFRGLLSIPSVTGRTELAAQKEILSKVAFIGRSKDMLRTYTSLNYYDGGLVVTETKTDTVYAGGRTSARPVVTVSSKVGTTEFWKMTGILFLLVLYSAMIYGPLAAYLTELAPVRVRRLPYDTGNDIIGGITPFIATLPVAFSGGNGLTGLWYLIGIAILSLVTGALYLPARSSSKA